LNIVIGSPFYFSSMKKLVLLLFVVGLIGCKTTEENYHKSYQAAIAKAREKDSEGIAPTTYNKILEQQKPKKTVVSGDTVRESRGYAWQFYGNDIPLKKYNVVVGAMKQQFNAKSLCDRLRKAGCNSYVITDSKRNFFVVADGFNVIEKASEYIQNIDKHIPFKLPIPEPYIYNTSRIYVKD
jgi:hypothetical protein